MTHTFLLTGKKKSRHSAITHPRDFDPELHFIGKVRRIQDGVRKDSGKR
jgi:hypothetical protein